MKELKQDKLLCFLICITILIGISPFIFVVVLNHYQSVMSVEATEFIMNVYLWITGGGFVIGILALTYVLFSIIQEEGNYL